MEIKLLIRNTENIGALGAEQVAKVQEILAALITSGGLTGVKGGKTIIHFDDKGDFRGIELDYWPWRKKAVHGG